MLYPNLENLKLIRDSGKYSERIIAKILNEIVNAKGNNLNNTGTANSV